MDNKRLIKEIVKLEILKTKLILDILPGQLGSHAKMGFDSFLEALSDVTKDYVDKHPKEGKPKEDQLNRVNIE
ncbi:MAG TPA: hypothetical protein VIO64_05845 [Pseudobacteroides sp.]|uniref:hypothetical protein n=1 Tax=Pseudobacteroides sp. TaxID=1968840 RepID=UPI002F950E69